MLQSNYYYDKFITLHADYPIDVKLVLNFVLILY